MNRISVIEAAQAMRAQLCAVENSRLTPLSGLPEISIDSRTLQPGQCFFAIRGPRFDGHDFVSEALAQGASLVVLSQRQHIESGSPALFLQVSDTTRALQELACEMRRRWGRPLLAVTGSAGKTTTRAFCAALLGRRFNVHQSRGNLNNEYGVPLSLFGLEAGHEFAVQELGMNHAGEIRRLGEICRPNAALVTNVAPVHLEFFQDIEGIARAKAEVLEALPDDGCFFYNADDPRVRAMKKRFSGRKVGFGLDSECQVRIVDPHFHSPLQMTFQLQAQGRRTPMETGFAGWHALYNLASACAVALEYGVPFQEVCEAVEDLKLPPGRGKLLSLGTLQVWDDSYNSNPRALQLVLRSLNGFPRTGRLILALGEMLELGREAGRMHFESGQEAAKSAPDLLITVGDLGRQLAQGAQQSGMPKRRTLHFEDSQSAAEGLAGILAPGDFVLVKGSRGVGMERIVQALREQTALIEPKSAARNLASGPRLPTH